MFGYSTSGRFFLALLLSVTLIGNWAVCASGCEENTEHQPDITEKQANNENCLNQPEKVDGCPLTAAEFILQERQTVEVSAALTAVSSAINFNTPDSWRSVPAPQTRQNSPPGNSSIPIFVRFCILRI